MMIRNRWIWQPIRAGASATANVVLLLPTLLLLRMRARRPANPAIYCGRLAVCKAQIL